jgi:hypothetical protein
MGYLDQLEEAVKEEWQTRGCHLGAIKHILRNIEIAATEAFCLKQEWARISALINDNAYPDGSREGDTLVARARLVHQNRCNKLYALAKHLGEMMFLSHCELRIDETTAGTGLDLEAREAIAVISRVGEW